MCLTRVLCRPTWRYFIIFCGIFLFLSPHTQKRPLLLFLFPYIFIYFRFLFGINFLPASQYNKQCDRACNRPLQTSKRVSVVIFLVSLLFNSCGGTGGMSPLYFFFSVVGVLICRPFERERENKGGKNQPLLYRGKEIWTREIGFCLYRKRGGRHTLQMRQNVCVRSFSLAGIPIFYPGVV